MPQSRRYIEPVDVTADSNHATVRRFKGYSIRETAGATASVNLRRRTVSGQIVSVIELAANESSTVFLPSAEHIPANDGTGDGIYVEVVSGAVEGVLYAAR